MAKREFNPKHFDNIDSEYLSYLSNLENEYGLPSGLLQAVDYTESSYKDNAKSHVGASGRFQFMPATAEQYGVNVDDKYSSAVGAAKMYRDLSKKYGGDLPSMLASYNWGQGNVDRKGLANAPQETRDYIDYITNTIMPYQKKNITNNVPEGTNEVALEDEFTPEQWAAFEALQAQAQPEVTQEQPVNNNAEDEFTPEQWAAFEALQAQTQPEQNIKSQEQPVSETKKETKRDFANEISMAKDAGAFYKSLSSEDKKEFDKQMKDKDSKEWKEKSFLDKTIDVASNVGQGIANSAYKMNTGLEQGASYLSSLLTGDDTNFKNKTNEFNKTKQAMNAYDAINPSFARSAGEFTGDVGSGIALAAMTGGLGNVVGGTGKVLSMLGGNITGAGLKAAGAGAASAATNSLLTNPVDNTESFIRDKAINALAAASLGGILTPVSNKITSSAAKLWNKATPEQIAYNKSMQEKGIAPIAGASPMGKLDPTIQKTETKLANGKLKEHFDQQKTKISENLDTLKTDTKNKITPVANKAREDISNAKIDKEEKLLEKSNKAIDDISDIKDRQVLEKDSLKQNYSKKEEDFNIKQQNKIDTKTKEAEKTLKGLERSVEKFTPTKYLKESKLEKHLDNKEYGNQVKSLVDDINNVDKNDFNEVIKVTSRGNYLLNKIESSNKYNKSSAVAPKDVDVSLNKSVAAVNDIKERTLTELSPTLRKSYKKVFDDVAHHVGDGKTNFMQIDKSIRSLGALRRDLVKKGEDEQARLVGNVRQSLIDDKDSFINSLSKNSKYKEFADKYKEATIFNRDNVQVFKKDKDLYNLVNSIDRKGNDLKADNIIDVFMKKGQEGKLMDRYNLLDKYSKNYIKKGVIRKVIDDAESSGKNVGQEFEKISKQYKDKFSNRSPLNVIFDKDELKTVNQIMKLDDDLKRMSSKKYGDSKVRVQKDEVNKITMTRKDLFDKEMKELSKKQADELSNLKKTNATDSSNISKETEKKITSIKNDFEVQKDNITKQYNEEAKALKSLNKYIDSRNTKDLDGISFKTIINVLARGGLKTGINIVTMGILPLSKFIKDSVTTSMYKNPKLQHLLFDIRNTNQNSVKYVDKINSLINIINTSIMKENDDEE